MSHSRPHDSIQPAMKHLLLLLLLMLSHPCDGQTVPSPLEELSALETSISTSWRNTDRVRFRADLGNTLAGVIPKALLEIGGQETSALMSAQRIAALKVFFARFLDSVYCGGRPWLTVFSKEQQFADLYDFLQEKFITVNSMIESNFHAIKDLKSAVLCGQNVEEVKSRQIQINAFFARYEEMMRRAKTDRGEALRIFDSELPQYQSAKILLEMRHLLMDKSLYANLVIHCATGGLLEFLRMMIELQQAFRKAIILDMAAKTRLFNHSKEALNADRSYWRGQVSQVVSLMVATGTELVIKSWYNFYRNDVDRSLSSTAMEAASNAAGSVNTLLTSKYPYIRTAVLIIPHDAVSIEITDAYGAAMRLVNENSFICYRSHRASGETVLVLCRNWIVHSKEQPELDTAYATYSKGVLSLGLVDALRNNRWDDIACVMSLYEVSFFAVRVGVKLRGGAVSAVQSKGAADLVFCQTSGTAFQALVVAKLVTGVSAERPAERPAVPKAVVPKPVSGAGPLGGDALRNGLWASAAVAVTLWVTSLPAAYRIGCIN